MRYSLRRLLPSAMLVSALLWAVSAVAAPVNWQQVTVTLHSEESGGVLLVAGELPSSARLPAEVELSVPSGATLQWVGQILGGDPSADPELTYDKSTVNGSDVYRFTLTKSRIAQLEITTSDAARFDGTDYESVLKWTATQAIPEVRLGARVPQAAQIVKAAPGAALEPSESGYSYYAKTVKDVKPGDQIDMAFAYQVPAAPASGASPASSGSAAQVIVIILAIAGAAFVVLAVRRKMALASAAGPEPEASSAENARLEPESDSSTKASGRSARVQDAQSAATADQPDEATSEQVARPPGASKRKLMTAVIVGSIIVIAFVIGKQTTKPQIEGDSISQTFSQGQPCSTATIALAIPADADPAKTAETLFAALKAAAGMNTATYNFKTSTLEAGFCESKATEESVRQALASTGLLASSAPAENAPAGTSSNGQ